MDKYVVLSVTCELRVWLELHKKENLRCCKNLMDQSTGKYLTTVKLCTTRLKQISTSLFYPPLICSFIYYHIVLPKWFIDRSTNQTMNNWLIIPFIYHTRVLNVRICCLFPVVLGRHALLKVLETFHFYVFTFHSL